MHNYFLRKLVPMNKLKISISCIALSMLTLQSCKKKDEAVTTTETTTTKTAAANTGEETKSLTVEELSKGVAIKGAIEKTGTPPAPNSDLDFQMNSEKQQGIQNEGFDIKFTSSEDIAGAYIRLADVDGNKVDGYIDVPVTKRNSRPTNKSTHKKSVFGRSTVSEITSNEYEIDIDFEETLSPGKFCYFICLYNASNQISQIQERCVTVEEWGGNDALVGTWKLIGEKKGYYYFCNNGDSVFLKDKIISSEDLITFNADGTYYLTYKEEWKDYDLDVSLENCSLIYEDTLSKNDGISKGQWAYDGVVNSLTIVEYEFIDNIEPEDSEVYNEGELVLDKIGVSITGNQLVLTDKEDDEEITFTKQ